MSCNLLLRGATSDSEYWTYVFDRLPNLSENRLLRSRTLPRRQAHRTKDLRRLPINHQPCIELVVRQRDQVVRAEDGQELAGDEAGVFGAEAEGDEGG